MMVFEFWTLIYLFVYSFFFLFFLFFLFVFFVFLVCFFRSGFVFVVILLYSFCCYCMFFICFAP